MYLAGVSVRRVEDIRGLWAQRVSPGTVSNLNQKIYGQIEAWRHRPIEGEQPMFTSTASCSSAAGRRGAQRLAAGGDLGERRRLRQILGIVEAPRRTRRLERFPAHLKDEPARRRTDRLRCLHRLVESAAEFFPTRAAGCMVHFYRNVFSHVRPASCASALMLKAIHAQEDLAAAHRKAAEVVARPAA